MNLLATPDSDQVFLNWSGDVSGAMAQSRAVTANFSDRARLRADRAGLEGLTPEGFRFTIVSDPQQTWRIFSSSNLNTWQPLGEVTNSQGEV